MLPQGVDHVLNTVSRVHIKDDEDDDEVDEDREDNDHFNLTRRGSAQMLWQDQV